MRVRVKVRRIRVRVRITVNVRVRVKNLGLRVQGFKDWGSGLGFRCRGLGFRVLEIMVAT